MAGARNQHNDISGNIFTALHGRLRGKSCRPYNSDTKVRIRLPRQTRFYYSDTQVTCQPNPRTDSFQDHPRVIVEVLSKGTRRLDEGEKKDAYLTIPSLGVYLLVEQETPAVVAYRRAGEGFEREVYEGLDAVIPLPEIETELPLAEIYEDVELLPEPDDADGA
jgi:Uma2 family endonuclease